MLWFMGFTLSSTNVGNVITIKGQKRKVCKRFAFLEYNPQK